MSTSNSGTSFGNLPYTDVFNVTNFRTNMTTESVDTAAATAATLKIVNISGGVLLHAGTGTIDVTTPSAAEFMTILVNPGSTMKWYHRKSGSNSATYVAGTGVTLADSVVVANATVAELLAVATSATTVTIYRLDL
jgi:hypothetical protein